MSFRVYVDGSGEWKTEYLDLDAIGGTVRERVKEYMDSLGQDDHFDVEGDSK